MSSTCCHRIVLFTKPAVPGLVKTRLQSADGSDGPVLSASQAAELHLAFLQDSSGVLQAVVDSLPNADLEMAWALDGGLQPELGFEGVAGFAQVGQTLGQRLYHGLARCAIGTACDVDRAESKENPKQPLSTECTESPERPKHSSVPSGTEGRHAISVAVAVGSDHPELQGDTVLQAIEVIVTGKADLAIGPAEDGGYYLLAVRIDALDQALFSGVRWSSSVVLEQTLSRARQLNLRVHQLDRGFDCDTPADLLGLCQRLGGDSSVDENCAATRRWLTENDFLAARELVERERQGSTA